MHVSNLNTTYFALAKGDDALSYENVIMQFNSAKAQSPLAISGLLRERERENNREKWERLRWMQHENLSLFKRGRGGLDSYIILTSDLHSMSLLSHDIVECGKMYFEVGAVNLV